MAARPAMRPSVPPRNCWQNSLKMSECGSYWKTEHWSVSIYSLLFSIWLHSISLNFSTFLLKHTTAVMSLTKVSERSVFFLRVAVHGTGPKRCLRSWSLSERYCCTCAPSVYCAYHLFSKFSMRLLQNNHTSVPFSLLWIPFWVVLMVTYFLGVYGLSSVFCLLDCVSVSEATQIILMPRGHFVIDFSSNA